MDIHLSNDNTGSRAAYRSAPLRHEYLGGLRDVPQGAVQAGQICTLPVLFLDAHTVMLPTVVVPVLMDNEHTPWEANWRRAVREALGAKPPLRGLVVCAQSTRRAVPEDGAQDVCVAEIAQESCERVSADGDSMPRAVVLKGRYRAEPIRSDATRMRVRIVPDYEPPAMPRPYRDGEAHWPLWAAAQFDAHRWSDRVRRLCAQHFPDIRVPSLPPQRLSWWLVANLPVAARSCQELFRTRCVAKRLRKIHGMLVVSGIALHCGTCLRHVADADRSLPVSEQGPGGVFINAHGCLHDLLCLSGICEGSVVHQGAATTQDTWFPGYAWTVMVCGRCWTHLGWRFDKREGDGPVQFWGISKGSVSA